MDVVLTPTGSSGSAWVLADRLGRRLGTVTASPGAIGFQILPEASGLLKGVKREHPSLDAAMSAIADLAQGACTLDSQDWD